MSTRMFDTIRKTDLEDLRWVAREAVAMAAGAFQGSYPHGDGLAEYTDVVRNAWALGAIGMDYELPIPGTHYDDLGDSVLWPAFLSADHIATIHEATGQLAEHYRYSITSNHDYPAEREAFYGAKLERVRRVRSFLEQLS